MPNRSAAVECWAHPGSTACPIRVRYSDVPGTLTNSDLAAGGFDCHLVQIQPARDGTGMEVHFTACCRMLADLARALSVDDIASENRLLSPLSGEYRQAGLFVAIIPELLDEDRLMARLQKTGRPVELQRLS